MRYVFNCDKESCNSVLITPIKTANPLTNNFLLFKETNYTDLSNLITIRIFIAQKNIPVIRRAEMLGELISLKETSIAVGGTHGKTTTSSMIGTFYRSPSPDKPPFVNIGDTIKEGDTICIIEAMKLFNEIESEISGKIVKVLVDDATPIEFGQDLFLIDPS